MKREEELARRRAGLSEAKRALLAERLQHSLLRKIPSVSIKKRESDQKMVLSFAQQRLWFLDQLAPSNPFYNMPLTIHLDGLLQVSILLRCLQELVERHESLRTHFVMNSDEPVQVVTPENRLPLPLIDLRELPEEQQRLTVQQLSEIEAQHPFDLADGALIRSTLLQLTPQKHILLITMHHIISDGWSIGILYYELTVLYQAFREGAASPLPPLPLQYADYAIFEREWLQGELLQKQLAYWREQLAHLTPLDLPLDHPRPSRQTFRGSALSFTLAADLVQKIQALCQQEGITLFIVLLSALQMLLARYTGLDDIAVGTPIAGRTKVELEGIVGCFVNTLVIRTHLSGNPPLCDILRSVRHVVEAAFNHQDVPFEKLVEELQPERSLSQSPLIQTLFTLKVPIDNTRDIAQLRLHAEEQETQTTQFDLMLTMSEVQNGIVGQFQYNTNLFELSTIQHLAEHFSTLLQAIVDTPQQTLWDTPMLSDEEQRQILHQWNATNTEVAGTQTNSLLDLCIHELFERQVESTPDAVALVFEEQHLTYMEINRQANHLAHHLLEAGVGPDVLVGVCLDGSLELVVALLAVLKAGGAYVPLDPAYPQERLAFLLSDAQIPVVLTQSQFTTVLPVASTRSLICLDTYWESGHDGASGNPVSQVMADNLAYVIYTSGSTGLPKGVGIYQKGLLNLLLWFLKTFHITAQDQVLVVTSFSFDLTQKNLLAPLLVGGTVNIQSGGYNSSLICQSLAQRQISLLNCTPSMFYPLLEERENTSFDHLSSLRCVFLGGEPIVPYRLRAWLQTPQCHTQVFNTYGPTECSDVVAFSQIDANVLSEADIIPIGRPISNVQLLILNDKMQLVPPLVKGELHVAGPCLGIGYRHQSQLTAAKFVPNPFGEVPGSLLYKTGDLARYRHDGTIEFLGRFDDQVKLRGFRIELGEIETALRTHPAVQEAVVVLCEEATIGQYLTAYVVGQYTEQPTPRELQNHLRRQLPDYMVPTVFVELETLPLTPHGKVNRKALPVPERTAQSKEGYVAPQAELEQRLAVIWQQVLGLTQVGVYDNFFDLGGHSLLLIRVRSKLEAYLGYEVSVVDLFQYPTIHALSTYLSGQQEQQALLQPIAERVRKRKDTLSTEVLHTSHDGIAIVGLASRFPGARNIDEFWQNLCNGIESISFFAEEELLAAGITPELVHNKRYVKAHAILDDVESFDAAFFGYSPKEAAMMDPQQRLFLECAWEVLEQAGVIERSDASDTYRGPIGVYAGQSASSYLLSNVLANPTFLTENGAFATLISNDKDYLATRTSYKLNLEGPSMTIQTACSTSLVAVHMACQGLLRYECDMALAGGASIAVPQKIGYLYEEEGILSPDGHCRAFDAEARGTVAGSGVGIVALKRLSDALTDGDTIYAVIRGSAINNDGAAKVGYTAPSIKGQVKVIAEAMAMAGVEPESISYVETHGTGTVLGDPIEIAALTQAFGTVGTGSARGARVGQGKGPVSGTPPTCAIGSVKTNLGHLDAAAGIAGLIKTVLALKHGMLPPSLHFHHPNPKIDFAQTPFYVNTHLKPWKRGSTPRRAGVSAFGIGGTNAHIILEEAPSPKLVGTGGSSADHTQHQNEKPLSTDRPHLVLLSAKTASALETMTQQLATYVQTHPDAHLADMAYTLQMGRKSFPHRRAFVAHDRPHMLHLLQTRDPESVFTDFVSPETQQVALSTSARWAGGPTDQIILSSLRHPQTPTSDRAFLLNTCGRLWCAGVSIDWSQLYADRQRRRVPLPTYPFERERYWSLPIGTRTDAVRTGQTQADRDSSWPLSEPLQPISESLQVPTAPENGWRPLRKEPDMAQWFSVPSWKLSPLPAVWTLPKQSKSCWLIFTDPLGLGTRLAEHLRGQQGTVITVQAGTQFRRSRECGVLSGVGILGEEDKYLPLQGSGGEGRGESATDPGRSATDPGTWEYTIRPENREDYDSLLNDISSAGLFPAHIIHMWMVIAIDQTTSGLDYSETAQTLGFSSLLFLTQALGKQKGEQSQEIAIISNNLQEVTGREVLCPARATALGVGKIAPYEYPHLSFRSIDIIVPATTGQALVGTGECPVPTDGEQLVDQIITELRSRSADSVVAYRGPHRWVRCVEPIRLEKVPEEESSLGRRQGKTQGLRQEGVYLITGGLGGIGLTVAEDLARRVNARLVLTGRTALPAREEWDHLWDKPTGYQDAEVSKIRQIKRLEELGAEVLVIQADVTDLGQMQAVVSQTQQRFGALHGVFHTAGIFADGLIQMRRPEAAANVLAPKVRGTLVLEAVLKNVQLDFLILFSSLAALIGELGRVDYCAANTFLDSFAFYHTTQRRVRTISINWDGWQEVGMSVKDLTAAQKALQYQPELQMQLQNGMLSREGVEVLRRIIAHGTTPQLIVSTSNILTRLGRAEAYLHPAQSLASYGGNGQAQSTIPPSRNGKGPSAVPRISHQRPHLQTAYVAPQNETQQHIADLWQKFLGIEKIGIHDNFIDLGGNSLLATQLITRLRDTFQVDLTLRTLFEEPTIARLTTILLQKKAEFIDDALLLQDIEDVEHLTDDEVQALLAADRNQTERTQNR